MSATFDRFAQTLGGACYPSANTDASFAQFMPFMAQCRRRALAHINSFSPHAATYRLENGWILNGKFNATADIEEADGVDCIGINVGIAHVICNLFRAMLSHRAILTRIGHNRREENQTFKFETAVDLENFTALKAPKDMRRARYAFQLSYCAFHFIFLHEFGHLFHGHIDWLRRYTGTRRLGEIGASSISGLKPIDLQTIEMDADCFGITDLLNAALGASYGPSDQKKPPYIPDTNVFGTRANAIFTVLFAVCCVFRLFAGGSIRDDEAVSSADHPPAIYRQRFVLGSIHEFNRELKVIPMPNFAGVVTDAIVEAEEAFAILLGTSALKGLK